MELCWYQSQQRPNRGFLSQVVVQKVLAQSEVREGTSVERQIHLESASVELQTH